MGIRSRGVKTIPEPRDLCTGVTLQENDGGAQCPADFAFSSLARANLLKCADNRSRSLIAGMSHTSSDTMSSDLGSDDTGVLPGAVELNNSPARVP